MPSCWARSLGRSTRRTAIPRLVVIRQASKASLGGLYDDELGYDDELAYPDEPRLGWPGTVYLGVTPDGRGVSWPVGEKEGRRPSLARPQVPWPGECFSFRVAKRTSQQTGSYNWQPAVQRVRDWPSQSGRDEHPQVGSR